MRGAADHRRRPGRARPRRIETAVVSMARALARRGHQVRIAGARTATERMAGVDYVPNTTLASDLRDRPCDLFLSCRHHDVLNQPITARMVGLWYHDHADAHPGDQLRSIARLFLIVPEPVSPRRIREAIRGLAPYAEVTSNGVDFEAVNAVLAGRSTNAAVHLRLRVPTRARPRLPAARGLAGHPRAVSPRRALALDLRCGRAHQERVDPALRAV